MTKIVDRVQLERGAFCVSIDVEFAWGFWDLAEEPWMRPCWAAERDIIDRLLDLFDQFDVPATWALVGALLDPNADHKSSDADRDHWFAPEVASKIAERHVGHEIGSHTQTHRYFDEIDHAAAETELAGARQTHEQLNLPFQSLVFPRNAVGHLDVAAANGISVYRPRDVTLDEKLRPHSEQARRLAHIASWTSPKPAPTVSPVIDTSGLVGVPGSMHLLSRVGLRRVPAAVTKAKAAGALRAAVRRREVFHLWFHPSNFFFEPDIQFDVLGDVLRQAQAAALRGDLDLRTMGSFAHVPSASFSGPARL